MTLESGLIEPMQAWLPSCPMILLAGRLAGKGLGGLVSNHRARLTSSGGSAESWRRKEKGSSFWRLQGCEDVASGGRDTYLQIVRAWGGNGEERWLEDRVVGSGGYNPQRNELR